MTITREVQDQLIDTETRQPRYIPTTRTGYSSVSITPIGVSATTSPVGSGNNGTPWTEDEHERFLVGLELFPSGPWKSIANCVGTRTARQTMSHAQKYRQKLRRHQKPPAAVAVEFSAQQHLHQFNEELARQQQQAGANGSASAADTPMVSFVTDGLSELHLTSEQIDEIIVSLFDDDDQPLFLTSEDLEWLMAS
ncbi:Myb-like dna-binding protein [Globisporangium polare]